MEQLDSDEMSEVMRQMPHWLIRWGFTILFTILLLFLVVANFIKYPDAISGTVSISSSAPIVKVTANISGYIDTLLVSDGDLVTVGSSICIFENPSRYLDVLY